MSHALNNLITVLKGEDLILSSKIPFLGSPPEKKESVSTSTVYMLYTPEYAYREADGGELIEEMAEIANILNCYNESFRAWAKQRV